MTVNISTVWEELERECQDSANPSFRTYRLLGNSIEGIRASYIPQDSIIELLIEVPPTWTHDKVLPRWRGMHFEVTNLKLQPRSDMFHLRLYLDDFAHKPIFITFCEDLVDALENTNNQNSRIQIIEACLERWSRFFDKCGTSGLKPTAQRGLMGELIWLDHLLSSDITVIKAVSSWKGCERNYHDFDLDGMALEVKTTLSKEPRFVRISNERQLDDRGISSLHLYVATLHVLDGGGITLPGFIHNIREKLATTSLALLLFEQALINSGYHKLHEPIYTTNYVFKKEELFEVRDLFPRIIDIPQGTGKLRYNVVLSACIPYLTELEKYLLSISERANG